MLLLALQTLAIFVLTTFPSLSFSVSTSMSTSSSSSSSSHSATPTLSTYTIPSGITDWETVASTETIPLPSLSLGPSIYTVVIVSSAFKVTSTASSSSPSNGVTLSHNQKIGIIIGSTVGALAFIGGLVVASFRYKHFNHRWRKDEVTNTTPVVYDLKIAVPINEALGSSFEKVAKIPPKLVLAYVPPVERETRNSTNQAPESLSTVSASTRRQLMLREQAGSIQEEISAIIEIATSATGVSEDTVVVQRRIIQELTNRVHVLEELLNSDWARELTDEPPPQYSDNFSHIQVGTLVHEPVSQS